MGRSRWVVQFASCTVPTSLPSGPQITADLLSNGIDVYPQKEFDEDSEDRLVNEKFRVSAPTRLLFPEAPHFLLEDMGGGSFLGSRKMGGMVFRHKEVLSGLGEVGARGSTCSPLRPRGLRAGGPTQGSSCQGPRGPAFARASD